MSAVVPLVAIRRFARQQRARVRVVAAGDDVMCDVALLQYIIYNNIMHHVKRVCVATYTVCVKRQHTHTQHIQYRSKNKGQPKFQPHQYGGLSNQQKLM